jgi:hypothetical protein
MRRIEEYEKICFDRNFTVPINFSFFYFFLSPNSESKDLKKELG